MLHLAWQTRELEGDSGIVSSCTGAGAAAVICMCQGSTWLCMQVDRYLSAAGYLDASLRPFFVALPKVPFSAVPAMTGLRAGHGETEGLGEHCGPAFLTASSSILLYAIHACHGGAEEVWTTSLLLWSACPEVQAQGQNSAHTTVLCWCRTEA